MSSVLLPTRRWTPACEELLAQVGPDDELLFVCDAPDDPIAAHPGLRAAVKRGDDADEGSDDGEKGEAGNDGDEDSDGDGNSDGDAGDASARLLVAGEPTGCSGKANAIAHGLERAASDQRRFVWTDADFAHAEGWLARLEALGERHGPVSGVPVFVSEGWAWRLFEPAGAVLGSLAIERADRVWGGCVTFTRGDVNLDALVGDLRRTVSDDGLLWEHLAAEYGGPGVTTTRELVSEVPVAGTPRAVANRAVRNNRIVYMTDPAGTRRGLLGLVLFAGLSLLAPAVAAGLATLVAAATYRYLGVRRWTWLLAWPAFLLAPLGLAAGILGREFRWGGRRYRWRSKFDVSVCSGTR
jgi:hypothetical protein